VQRTVDRDAGVLEPREVYDALHGVLLQRLGDKIGVDDAAFDEGDIWLHERAVTAGEIVDHHGFEADFPERPDDVCADVAGPSGHQPRHRHAPRFSTHSLPDPVNRSRKFTTVRS
jgi:hypothetical protein